MVLWQEVVPAPDQVEEAVTWVTLLDAPLLLVSLSFPNETSWRIQWAPVLGESGWTYSRLPARQPLVNTAPSPGPPANSSPSTQYPLALG